MTVKPASGAAGIMQRGNKGVAQATTLNSGISPSAEPCEKLRAMRWRAGGGPGCWHLINLGLLRAAARNGRLPKHLSGFFRRRYFASMRRRHNGECMMIIYSGICDACREPAAW